MEKIKLFSMFSGFGGAEFALKEASIDYEVVGFSEIDKFAIQCYQQNHGYIHNYGDCTKINPKEIPDFDLLTGGFPCQTFSVAGNQKGEQDTRGTLFYEIIRIAEYKKPKWIVLENVKGLLTDVFKDTFNKILSELDRIGYNVQWRVLNTKEHGIPQNRERVIFVCYRKDLSFDFTWPEKEPLNLKLKDLLENEVDKKYYLNEIQINNILNSNFNQNKTRIQKDITQTLCARDYKDPKCVNTLFPNVTEISQTNKIYLTNGLSPIVDHTNKITIGDFRYDEGFRPRKDGISPSLCSTMRESFMSGSMPIIVPIKFLDRNQKNYQGEYSNTIDTCNTNGLLQNNSIRRLTPIECFRLQGFTKDQINLEELSDSQRYKLAGNGWSINVFTKLFTEMFINKKKPKSLLDF